ncbi:hypothetical protein DSO57_1011246 [Entomophthora muscae]|uniref:Uncharacterized protein n=1 Tax=Entomophthora muscae TaxID=34485 RepID=A0ACC2RXB5_9FUNG|nr:hypothetical protein DSO57_1011246 [Entomophthora muscae]
MAMIRRAKAISDFQAHLNEIGGRKMMKNGMFEKRSSGPTPDQARVTDAAREAWPCPSLVPVGLLHIGPVDSELHANGDI